MKLETCRKPINELKQDMRSVIESTLDTLGIPESFFLMFLRSEGVVPRFDNRDRWDVGALGASDWIWIHKVLHVSLNSMQIGYDQGLHQRSVAMAIARGIYVFPWTKKIRLLYRNYLKQKKREHAYSLSHTSEEMSLKKSVFELKERQNKKRLRALNRRRFAGLRAKILRLYQGREGRLISLPAW